MKKINFLFPISAVLTAISFFPFKGHSVFILFSFSPLLRALRGNFTVWDFFIWGITFYGVTLYWIIRTVKHYGATNWFIATLAYILLSLYLSLHLLAIGLVCKKSKRPLITFIALYPLIEWIRSFLFGGFPLLIISHVLADTPVLTQGGSILGQFGLSLLILLCNLGIEMTISKKPKGIIILSTSLLLMSMPYLEKLRYDGNSFKIAILQPNISEEEKWNPALRLENTRKMINLIKIACNTGADLVVTPETTIPIFFGKEKELTQIVLEELKDCRSNIILGVIDYIEEGKIRVYLNKAVHIKEGSVVAEYTKNILVPFGEYVPFRNILTELIKNVSWPEDFKEGDKLIPFNINGYVSVTPICYEICFPFYMAQYKKEFIISLTNDMWFGKTIAPYLHLWAGSLRSVENRSYIIRSANTGISAIIDPKGYQLLATKLFEPEIAVKTIQTVEPKDTVFQQVPYLSLVLCFLILIRSLI